MTVKNFIMAASADIKFTFTFINGEYTKEQLLNADRNLFWSEILNKTVTMFWAIDINHIHIVF